MTLKKDQWLQEGTRRINREEFCLYGRRKPVIRIKSCGGIPNRRHSRVIVRRNRLISYHEELYKRVVQFLFVFPTRFELYVDIMKTLVLVPPDRVTDDPDRK